MTVPDPFVVAASALVGIGFYGFVSRSHPIRRLLAINLVGNGVFLALIRIAYAMDGGPDPVPHAMVLTGIVIAVTATAFGLAVARRRLNRPGPGEETGASERGS